MIGWIRGDVLLKRPPFLLLDVGGVGYELEVPMTSFYALPELGAEVTLFAHLVVREDAQSLYGFTSENERNVFRMLLRVNGVGAKMALAILSGMDAAALARCVYEEDTAELVRVPGVGKKTAQRLVMEMRDHFDRVPSLQRLRPGAVPEPPAERDDPPAAEAVNALLALGLKSDEADRRVRAVADAGLAVEEIIRRALQSMGRK